MYPYEVAEYLKQRNWYIGGDDLIKITSIKENPQLRTIKFNSFSNEYEMWDVEGNYYKFKAMPYKEALQKGLVKQKEADWER